MIFSSSTKWWLLGLILVLNLGFLSWPKQDLDSRYSSEGKIKGLSVESIGGVNFVVERFFIAPGFSSIQEALDHLDVKIFPEDRVVTVPPLEFGIGSLIEITRANPVKLIDGRKMQTVRTWATTVEDLLSEQNLELGDQDEISPELISKIVRNLTIKITRIGIKKEFQDIVIPYTTQVVNDASRDVCSQIISQHGVDGLKRLTYEVTYKNGEEVQRILKETKIVREPVREIIVKGTRITSFGSGIASWYRWRQGEAAHNTLPRGTKVRVVNVENGKSTVVTITDRGIHSPERIIDLDDDSFAQIAPLWKGLVRVRLEKAC